MTAYYENLQHWKRHHKPRVDCIKQIDLHIISYHSSTLSTLHYTLHLSFAQNYTITYTQMLENIKLTHTYKYIIFYEHMVPIITY